MSSFDLIAGALFIGIWMALGVVPWLVASVLTRGHIGVVLLPLCVFAGVTGGMLVPFLGFTNTSGIWLSFVVALMLPAILVIARRFANPALALDVSPSDPKGSPEPK